MQKLTSGFSRNDSMPASLLAGALGGLAASWVMNQFQSMWSKPEGQNEGDDATVKTAKAISHHLFSHQLNEEQKKWAGPLVHYAFGTLTGAVYGLVAATASKTHVGVGTAYGSAVWLGADEIGVPAFGLGPPPSQTPAASHVKALASHLVYGATTDFVRRLILSGLRKNPLTSTERWRMRLPGDWRAALRE